MERAGDATGPHRAADAGRRPRPADRRATGGYPTAVGHAVFGRDPAMRLVYLDGYSGPAEAVAATLGVAALAFLTGLAHLTGHGAEAQGLLAQYAPSGFEELLGLSDVVFGFLLLGVTAGLHYRFRLCYRVALALLPTLVLLSTVALHTVDVPLALASVAVLAVLVRNREAFDRLVHPSTVQVGASVAIVAVLVYGTVGTFALRDQFTGIRTLVDAFYFVVVSGIAGDGGAEPVSVRAKVFTLSVLVVGTASFTAALGAVVVPVVESRLADAIGPMTPSKHELLDDHVVVLGAGALLDPVLAELEGWRHVAVLASDPDAVSQLDDRDVTVIVGDPTDEDALRDAAVGRAAAAVAASDDDARDALAILAAREHDPDLPVVAAAADPANAGRLEAAGAGTVVSPTTIGGQLVGRAVRGEEPQPSLEFDGPDE